ncbi:bifunctional fructose-bisphosphatase/inositol-phosphate phosphatase [Thermococcus sp. 5-4]|uniref:bifunctional fructose-bisphosphatase/inositol-phosphate phosphatase n=1 Tax=Thermococcus sp. 5-4 TaxID=2008440 RepID=UPI000B49AC5E|nr:bifunctional fructose-bisphosphatase/inositol-phosphate phosphatase [Thermococcus sp. 5-4]ASA77845.1 fructose-1,6-bisphosphatase [Thermococcus sp. 5-4]
MEIPWNEIALEIAREVEKEVMPLFGTPRAGETIGENVSGDVTKYVDKVAEDVVLGRLQPLGVNIVSEEIGFIDNGSDYTVIVDPIDGSYNFAAGIPIFAFSFAVFRRNEPVYGAIYEFVRRTFYEALPGEGAYMDGRPIRVRKPERGKEALSFYTRGRCLGLIERVKRVRVLGAIAVELTYLAKGALDGVLDIRNYVRTTDIAAGVLIAKEAGAIVTDETGRELELRLDATTKTNVIAVNDRYLLDMILEELKNEP